MDNSRNIVLRKICIVWWTNVLKCMGVTSIPFIEFIRNPLGNLRDFEQFLLIKCVIESLGPGIMLLALSINSIRNSKISNGK